jgi:hypothetical protein
MEDQYRFTVPDSVCVVLRQDSRGYDVICFDHGYVENGTKGYEFGWGPDILSSRGGRGDFHRLAEAVDHQTAVTIKTRWMQARRS